MRNEGSILASVRPFLTPEMRVFEKTALLVAGLCTKQEAAHFFFGLV